MTPEQFAYWLQGFFELTETDQLSTNQVLMVKEHLQLVFQKVTGGPGGGGGSSGGGGGPEVPKRQSIYNEPTGKGRMTCSQEPAEEVKLDPFRSLDPSQLKRLLQGWKFDEPSVLVPPPISGYNPCHCHTRLC